MSTIESIEYFPLFDAESGDDPARVSVAVGSGVAAFGVPSALGGSGAVAIYFYSDANNGWGYVGVLSGSKIAGSEQVRGLGSSCIAVADTVIVGAEGDPSTPGRVFALQPPYGAWSYTAIPVVTELTYQESAKGDRFGASVAHCTDGTHDYVAVGAPGAPPPRGRTGSGRVFVYEGLETTSTPWSTAPIANPATAGTETDGFGASVAISPSADGSGSWDGTLTLAVGAPGANGGQGVVYAGRTAARGKGVFEFGEPLLPVFHQAADGVHTEGFGTAIALTGGGTLAVGSPNDPNPDAGIEGTGAVWIFSYGDGAFVAGPAQAPLYGAAGGMKFGASVAFPATSPSPDGQDKDAPPQAELLLVGAPGPVSGCPARAFVYTNDAIDGRTAGLSFRLDRELVGSSPQDGDGFGGAVAASRYHLGTWCLVGAAGNPKADQPGGGYLYVDGQPAPTWMVTPQLATASPTSTLRWGGLPPDWWKKFTPRIENYLG